ncbi:MAG: hypothetical protein FRX49_13429 [Trebouxia sp. A1-2]|nr:MAG: hypothetical protein FRX49_13429 [Trebouxia sp. A1-2]
MTPDRASQDSVLRRSQRVRDRQQALESIQEDTAASREAKPALERSTRATAQLAMERATEAAAQPAKSAIILRGTTAEGFVSELVRKPAPVSRAQAVQDAILQASDASSRDSDADLNTSDSEAESNVDILAQLSESMWASLRPDAHTDACTLEPAKAQRDAAQSDRKTQPKGLQAVNQDTEVDEEAELHWQPVTGLPEPLTAKACSSSRAAPAHSQLEKQFNLPPRDTRSTDKQARKLKPETAGKQWFDLPAQQLTDETRRDLKLLQLRGTFDPKRFYKSSDHKKGLPKFFQIGTVVEASADFYSGRLSNRERKRTITEELLADPDLSQARKRRFDKLQDEKAYWAGKRGRKTDLPRGKKTSRSKKH